MKPHYQPRLVLFKDPADAESLFQHLLNDLEWLEVTPARKEYFMAQEPLSYMYGTGDRKREYQSKEFTNPVHRILDHINFHNGYQYNVCFLNRYDTQSNALGWHADDSPEMNPKHPIGVVSFGAEREIWWKTFDHKGEVPQEQRRLLESGSMFEMPPGFQQQYFHKIPKADHVVGTRISLTFRNYVRVEGT